MSDNAPFEMTAVAAAVELLRRRAARKNLYDFILFVNPEYIGNDFSQAVCAEIDQFIKDVEAGLRPVLLLQAPPQHGKSDIVSRHLPAFLFGVHPEWNVGGLSYSMDLAGDMNRDVQRIMMTDEYAALFPNSVLGRRIKGQLNAKQNSYVFEIPGHRGSYRGAGVGGPLTGRKLNIGLIDDPIKNAQEALSETTKETIDKWYQSTFTTRLAKISGQIIMATSWALDDLIGRIVERNSRAKHIKFAAIHAPGDMSRPSTVEDGGVALVSELHPIEQLVEIKGDQSEYFWSAMYQQSPVPAGGAIFKETGIRYYLPKDLPTKFDKTVASWDCTFKDSNGTDFVAGHIWARRGAQAFLLARVHARMSFVKTCEAVLALHNNWPSAYRILIEDKANGPAVIDLLKSVVPGLIPVEPDGSKTARAHAVTAYWEAGNVFLPHPDIMPDIRAMVREVTTFTGDNKGHDDDVDAMTQALRDLFPERNMPIKIDISLLGRR